jgi:hypothetical protein
MIIKLHRNRIILYEFLSDGLRITEEHDINMQNPCNFSFYLKRSQMENVR